MYEYYSAAKKALATGTASCHAADELSKQTESMLEHASVVVSQIAALRDSLELQFHDLESIAVRLRTEEDAIRLEFDGTLRELDLMDGELNLSLERLRTTHLPAALCGGSSADGTNSNVTPKSLFEFADDAAVEALKGQLRQVIDDMQEGQEELAGVVVRHEHIVHSLEKILAVTPSIPVLALCRTACQDSRSTPYSASRKVPSLSVVAKSYKTGQAEHLHQMADLLVQLSLHYDHSCTLFRSETTLFADELQELQGIVENDARQLEDVLSELEECLVDLEEDINEVKTFLSVLIETQDSLIAAFKDFEVVDLDELEVNLKMFRKKRSTTNSSLDMFRQQLVGLSSHYLAFSHSYDSLLLEIDRRVKYEAGVAKFIQQTEQSFSRLMHDEMQKREQFVKDHGDTLPGDIWAGITDRPSEIQVVANELHTTPILPEVLIESVLTRFSPAQSK